MHSGGLLRRHASRMPSCLQSCCATPAPSPLLHTTPLRAHREKSATREALDLLLPRLPGAAMQARCGVRAARRMWRTHAAALYMEAPA